MNRTPASDEALAQAAQANDQAALAELYDRHVTPLYRYLLRHVAHVQDAEDLTSEVMTRMVKDIRTFQGRAGFRTWLFGIARHAVADLWRTRYRLREELVAEYAGIGASAPAVVEAPIEDASDPFAAQRIRAEQVYARLPENYRTVLQHRFIAQRTLEETAAMMQTTVGNVKVLQHRALKKAAAIAQEIV